MLVVSWVASFKLLLTNLRELFNHLILCYVHLLVVVVHDEHGVSHVIRCFFKLLLHLSW